jgi:hypothetical protein
MNVNSVTPLTTDFDAPELTRLSLTCRQARLHLAIQGNFAVDHGILSIFSDFIRYFHRLFQKINLLVPSSGEGRCCAAANPVQGALGNHQTRCNVKLMRLPKISIFRF